MDAVLLPFCLCGCGVCEGGLLFNQNDIFHNIVVGLSKPSSVNFVLGWPGYLIANDDVTVLNKKQIVSGPGI